MRGGTAGEERDSSQDHVSANSVRQQARSPGAQHMAGVESRNLAHSRHGAQGAHGRRGTWGLGTRQAWSPGAWHTAGREPGGLAHGRRGTRGLGTRQARSPGGTQQAWSPGAWHTAARLVPDEALPRSKLHELPNIRGKGRSWELTLWHSRLSRRLQWHYPIWVLVRAASDPAPCTWESSRG